MKGGKQQPAPAKLEGIEPGSVAEAPAGGGVEEGLGTLLDALDTEQAQEERVEKGEGSFFAMAPDDATMVARAREFDDLPKHWVRRTLWLKAAKRIFDAKQSGIRLLTLPGQNRFEIGLYNQEKLLGREGAASDSLSVVGFETDPTIFGLLATAQPPLLAMLRGDILDALLKPASANGQIVREHAPYDVINLDLTANIATKNDGPYSPFLQGVRECFQVQGPQSGAWALMVTFRAGMSDTEPGVINQLEKFFQGNIETHRKVKEACQKRYSSSTAKDMLEKHPEEGLGQITAKWIIEQGHSFEWCCSRFRHASYTRQFAKGGATSTYSLRKLIFEFEKRPLGKHEIPLGQIPVQSWHADDLARLFDDAALLNVDEVVGGLTESKRKFFLEEIEKLRGA